MHNRHYLLNDLLNNLYPSLNMRNNLRHFLITNYLNYFLYYLWDSDYLLTLDNFLYDFLDDNFNRFGHLFFSLHIPYHFLDDFNRSDLFLNDYLLHFHHNRFLYLHYLFSLNLFRLNLRLLADLDNHTLV